MSSLVSLLYVLIIWCNNLFIFLWGIWGRRKVWLEYIEAERLMGHIWRLWYCRLEILGWILWKYVWTVNTANYQLSERVRHHTKHKMGQCSCHFYLKYFLILTLLEPHFESLQKNCPVYIFIYLRYSTRLSPPKKKMVKQSMSYGVV